MEKIELAAAIDTAVVIKCDMEDCDADARTIVLSAAPAGSDYPNRVTYGCPEHARAAQIALAMRGQRSIGLVL